MWVKTQNGEEILKVHRFKTVWANEKGTEIKVLAKLDRETVVLGTYGQEQAEVVMDALWSEVSTSFLQKEYEMPVRWEDEK